MRSGLKYSWNGVKMSSCCRERNKRNKMQNIRMIWRDTGYKQIQLIIKLDKHDFAWLWRPWLTWLCVRWLINFKMNRGIVKNLPEAFKFQDQGLAWTFPKLSITRHKSCLVTEYKKIVNTTWYYKLLLQSAPKLFVIFGHVFWTRHPKMLAALRFSRSSSVQSTISHQCR